MFGKNECSMNHAYDDNASINEAQNKIMETLQNGGNQKEIEVIMASYPDQAAELQGYYETWIGMKDIEVPEVRPEMDATFYKTLSEMSAGQTSGRIERISNSKKLIIALSSWIRNPRLWSIIGAILVGVVIGKMTSGNGESNNTERIETESEQSNMLFAGNHAEITAFDRLEMIQKTQELNEPSPKLLEALNRTLIQDDNVNVRLSALETLIIFSDYPVVREYLIKSIPYQKSPIVLMELAELMIGLQEKTSAEGWKEVLESEHMENDVKHQLEKKLAQIL